MLPTKKDDDGYSAVQEAANIVAGTGFGCEVSTSLKAIRKRICMTLASACGPQWRRATVQVHVWPDGSTAYSASIKCARCGQIHVQLATLKDDGSLDFAASMEH